jgi:serine/threonine protein kinase
MGSVTDAVPRKLTDRYELRRVLGRGGMGVVYEAKDLLEGRVVAVKLLAPEANADQQAVERFVREAKNTFRLTHPNIVRVFDAGRAPTGELFYVMEHLEGESLLKVLRSGRPLSPEEAVDLVGQLAAALSAAHRSNIVHRDVKPGNVMLVTERGRRVVKLLDFGIARSFGGTTQLTATGTAIGTPEYMSPEQVLGQPIDHRSDLYAVGVILMNLLTGRPLFVGESAVSIAYHHVHTQPEPLTRQRPDLPHAAALEHIISRCLAKDPNDRFQDAEQLRLALEAALTDAAPPVAPLAVANLPYFVCQHCGADSSRFASRCERCGADLDTPSQRAFSAQTIAQREAVKTPDAAPEPVAPEPRPMATPLPARASAPRRREAAPAVDESWFWSAVSAVLDLPGVFFARVAAYSLLAVAVTWFFRLTGDGVRWAIGCVGLVALALWVVQRFRD